MSLDKRSYYEASCDVRLDRAGGEPLIPQPSREDWAAWDAAGHPGPETGRPEWLAIGKRCGERSDQVVAPSTALAKRQLMSAGWKIIDRRGGLAPKAACPKHREVDL